MKSTAPQSGPFLPPPLYPLSASRPGQEDASLSSLLEWARSCLEGGARLLQLREKPPPDPPADLSLWRQRTQNAARSLAQLCRQQEAFLIINDRADWVRPCAAAGVHLGQQDLDPREARRILGPKAVIGYSTHDEEQLMQAQDLPIDYVALGPIFASPSKPGAHPTVGLEKLEKLAGRSRLPVVAIGGITLQRAPRVWKAGAASIAVISDIADHPDPALRVRAYLQAYARLERP